MRVDDDVVAGNMCEALPRVEDVEAADQRPERAERAPALGRLPGGGADVGGRARHDAPEHPPALGRLPAAAVGVWKLGPAPPEAEEAAALGRL